MFEMNWACWKWEINLKHAAEKVPTVQSTTSSLKLSDWIIETLETPLEIEILLTDSRHIHIHGDPVSLPYLRSWPSDASCSIGCISSCGEGVSVAVDWWLYETAAGDEAAPRTGGVGPLSISSSSSSSSGCRYMWDGGMGHCMSGSQLPGGEKHASLPSYCSQKTWMFWNGVTGNHVLNIHTVTSITSWCESGANRRENPQGGHAPKEEVSQEEGTNAERVCARACVCVWQTLFVSHLSSIDREYSSVLRLGGGFAGGGGRRSAQFIVLCLGSLGVRTPFFWPWLPAPKKEEKKSHQQECVHFYEKLLQPLRVSRNHKGNERQTYNALTRVKKRKANFTRGSAKANANPLMPRG